MPRHRTSLRTARSWGSIGIRVAATLTLLLGVAGGLYLGDRKADKNEAAQLEAAIQAAEKAELDIIRADYAGWSRRMIEERAEDERIAREAAEAAAAEEARKKAAEEAARNKNRNTPTTNYPIPASCSEYSGHRATGCALMLDWGFPLSEFPCLEKLWTKESGWNPNSHNSGSGAHGIPQALPGDKMAVYGDDWATNPVPQIKWGLDYIKKRYSTPCGAWSKFQSQGWY